MINIPELLAPVGGMQQLKAAVENGADAVYLGGKLFNARINADNFDDYTLKTAISYAHLRNVKVYITMNILIKDDELEDALQYAKKLYEFGVDALIIQDLGFARLIKERLPSMKIHLSTQGTVYNESGVRMAKKLGFERVVLAREVTLEEIRAITKENILEIEVFVHGAMCICYSGQCQMSRILGGRSGNRGMCAQPCRLEFNVNDQKQGTHLLSPKDLCDIDFLGELAEAGVTSLKIEGRMKSAEYVAVVTRIYRKYLDEYKLKGKYKVEDEDRQKLAQIFNRGSFTNGYLKGDPEEQLMSTELPKHQGIYIGKVVEQAQRDLVDIKLAGKLSIGDGIEIRNKYMPGNVVTYLKPIKNNIIRVGDIKGKVWPNDLVYKITDKSLMKEARDSFEGESSSQILGYRKVGVNCWFKAQLNEKPKLKLTEGNIIIEIEGTKQVEKAINRSLSEGDIRKQLNKTGEVPFKILNFSFELDEDISLPMSELNFMRREAFIKLMAEKIKERKLTSKEMDIFYQLTPEKTNYKQNNHIFEDSQEGIQLELYFHTMKSINKNELGNLSKIIKNVKRKIKNIRIYLPLYEYVQYRKRCIIILDEITDSIFKNYTVHILPYLPNVTKGAYDSYIKVNFEEIISYCQNSGIAIGNLGWIFEFKNAGVQVYGDYGLNIYNNEAVTWCHEMDIVDFIPSHEVFKNDESEVAFAGEIPLMISEHLFNEKEFIDRKNKSFNIIKKQFENKSIIVQKMSNVENSIREYLTKKELKKLRIYLR